MQLMRWEAGMTNWYEIFFFCMNLRFTLRVLAIKNWMRKEGAMNGMRSWVNMRSWYEKLVVQESDIRIWYEKRNLHEIKVYSTVRQTRKSDEPDGKLVWEASMRSLYEKLVRKVGIRSWYEKLVWEVGMRSWYEKFFFWHEIKVYSTSSDENNWKLMNHEETLIIWVW